MSHWHLPPLDRFESATVGAAAGSDVLDGIRGDDATSNHEKAASEAKERDGTLHASAPALNASDHWLDLSCVDGSSSRAKAGLVTESDPVRAAALQADLRSGPLSEQVGTYPVKAVEALIINPPSAYTAEAVPEVSAPTSGSGAHTSSLGLVEAAPVAALPATPRELSGFEAVVIENLDVLQKQVQTLAKHITQSEVLSPRGASPKVDFPEDIVEGETGSPLAETVQAAVAVVLEAVTLAAVLAEECRQQAPPFAVLHPIAPATAAPAVATVVHLQESRTQSCRLDDAHVVHSDDTSDDDGTFFSAADGLSLRARPAYCSVPPAPPNSAACTPVAVFVPRPSQYPHSTLTVPAREGASAPLQNPMGSS